MTNKNKTNNKTASSTPKTKTSKSSFDIQVLNPSLDRVLMQTGTNCGGC